MSDSLAGSEAPVAGFLLDTLRHAVARSASDIHFEPYEHTYRLRIRVDGRLRAIEAPPVAWRDRLATCIKVLARLDIAERRLPQDGRMKADLDGRPLDCRVSTLPTLFGEKIVVRLLDTGATPLDLDALGYENGQRDALRAAIGRPHGLILVTGPTGSGKTVSLYSCLKQLNQPERNIATVEDPVEIHLAGVNQVNVNDKAGLDFVSALRAFLRQDPDVLMVGEIRDAQTADIAIKAAQTGHLVLSTLHASDAPSAISRLTNLAADRFTLAASLLLVTAQRLVRTVCPECSRPLAPTEAMRRALADTPEPREPAQPCLRQAMGCDACFGTGYRGRTGIYQVMPVSGALREHIVDGAPTHALARQAASEGTLTLRQAGLLKAWRGVTTLEEVFAATDP